MRMECDKPLISVLMGVYYHKADLAPLERSVRSILTQTYRNFELLICDGGSSLEATQLLDLLAAEDKRIRLIREEIPADLAHKLNACLRYARGELVARMDDDDFSYPERFARQIECLEGHPHISFVGCNVGLRLEGRLTGKRLFPQFPNVKDFYMTQPFIHPTLMFRSDVLRYVGGYSEDTHCVLCEDYDLLLRLYAVGFCGANIQEVLFDYTIPASAHGSRRMCHRWNETMTRWRRFRELGVLPEAVPYVLKPLVVGMIPARLLEKIKEKRK